jgi:hypothetical protein
VYVSQKTSADDCKEMNVEITTGRASEGGHWYNLLTGEPVYEIRGANGFMRPFDLRDARKFLKQGIPHGPGNTTIIRQLAAPQLEKWRRKQICMSARTLPGIEKLTNEDELFAAVEEDADAQARKAAARGTVVHAAIQGSFEGAPTAWHDAPYVSPVHAWIEERYGLQNWEAEKSCASLLGYGTKADLSNKVIPCIIDFKGKDLSQMIGKRGMDLTFWTHAMQLAATREALGLPHADCVNIFFCRDTPNIPVIAREWDEAELQKGWRMFKHCLGLWQEEKDYFPQLAKAA